MTVRSRAAGLGTLCCAALTFALAGCGSAPLLPSTAEATQEPEASPTTAAADVSNVGEQSNPALPGTAEPSLPPQAMAQFDKAVVMMTAGDAVAAEQAFRSLASAYPAYSGALLNLGILQTRSGRLEEAEKTIKSAIERNSGNAAAFNQLGIVSRRLGRFSEADAAYQQAIKLDPNYANAYLNLGVLCDLYLQQPQRALEAFERYLELAATPDQKVTGWVSELKARLGSQQRSARSE